MSDVDLSQLAVDRDERPSVRHRRHLLTRYLLPAIMVVGFALMVGWMSWGFIFPARKVKVIPVYATQSEIRQEGTPLFSAAGWIEPRPTAVRVAALAPGVVEQLLVVEDQAVRLGDSIAELVKDDARLKLEAAKADLQLQQAELEHAKATLVAAQTRFKQPVHIEAELAEANAELAKITTTLNNLPFETKRAQARLKYAEAEYQRNKKLAEKNSVSQRDFEKATSDFEESSAMVEELKSRQNSLEQESLAIAARASALNTRLQLLADEIREVGESAAKVKAAEARIEQCRVAIDEAKLRYDRMTIRAPIDGRIYQLLGQPGTRVGASSNLMDGRDGSTIVTMYRPEMLQIRVDVRFEDIPKVSLGQPVRIDNPALSKPVSGYVLFVSSEADIQKNTLQVKVAIDSPLTLFKPEMLVDVTFVSPKRMDESKEIITQQLRLYIPGELINADDDGPFTWVADQSSGRAQKTAVTVGPKNSGKLVEVMEGLTVASRIITTTDGLRDGLRIRVSGEDLSFNYQPNDKGAN